MLFFSFSNKYYLKLIETVNKIEFHSSVPYKRLLELMSNDVIPEEYGGTNKIDYPHTTSK